MSFQIESAAFDEQCAAGCCSVDGLGFSRRWIATFQEPASQKIRPRRDRVTAAAVSIASGEKYMVRVTVDVPSALNPVFIGPGSRAGTSACTPPKPGEHNILFRFRYMETLYVIVQPVAARPSLVSAVWKRRSKAADYLQNEERRVGLCKAVYRLTLRNESHAVVAETKSREATVLRQCFIERAISAGKYSRRQIRVIDESRFSR